jgi:hypothetical protein
MQTGAEADAEGRIDYEQYVANGRREDMERIRDMLNDRFAEAPCEEDAIRDSAMRRGLYDLPMVWSCRKIAKFLGGDTDGKRTGTDARGHSSD